MGAAMEVFITTYEGNKKETKKQTIPLSVDKGAAMNVVNVYTERTYQTFLGFGGAVTEAAGYAFSKLSEEKQKEVLKLYFGEEGNRYSMVRTHLDSCDFSLKNYSAMEDAGDIQMKSFSLQQEEEYILPLLRAAREERGEALDLMLSPWSPPAFMKTNGDRNHGGKLKEEYKEFWAEYICRYIKEYEKKGFLVNRITIQNEPEAVQTWDSCIYTSEEEKEFLRDYLYKALKKHNLSHIKINIWDHNKERLYERAMEVIDRDTVEMIDGIAFHWYTGDHFEAIALTKEAFPGKELIFTEGCVEYSRFDKDQLRNAQMYAHDMIGNINAGMTGFIDWNIFLDEKGGPNHVNNFCDAPIMIDTNNDNYEIKLSFDYIGHFSRYIQKGAKRIAYTSYTDKLEITAFKNPDDTIAVVLLNRTNEEIPVSLRMEGYNAEIAVAKNSIATGVIDRGI